MYHGSNFPHAQWFQLGTTIPLLLQAILIIHEQVKTPNFALDMRAFSEVTKHGASIKQIKQQYACSSNVVVLASKVCR